MGKLMYTLYYSPGTASLAVHWMLIELKVPYQLELVDLESKQQKSTEYLKLNPSGVVPTLVVDSVPRAECAALLMLLAERHADAELAPALGSPERAEYLQWMLFFANTLQPAFRAWFYPDEPAGAANADAAQAQARARIESIWDRVDSHLATNRSFFIEDKLSAADFLGTMLMRWSRNMPKPATQWSHINEYLKRMRAMHSLKEVHRIEGLTDWISAG